MKKIYYILIALGLFCSLAAKGEPQTATPSSVERLDKIIAIVDREPITESQLSLEVEKAKKQIMRMNQTLPADNELRQQVLDNIIAKSLQMQLAKAHGINIKKEEVDKAISNIAKANKLSVAQLKAAVEESGLPYDEYHSQLTEQMTFQKLQQEEISKKISFTPDDVKEYMQKNKDKFSQYSAFHLIDITLPANETADSKQVEPIRKQATALAEQLKNTKELEPLLKQYPSAIMNDLGWRSLPEVPSLFQSKVALMKINAVSAPMQAPNGFHILKLIDAKGENQKLSEEEIKNIVYHEKAQVAIKEWLAQLRKDAYVKIIH